MRRSPHFPQNKNYRFSEKTIKPASGGLICLWPGVFGKGRPSITRLEERNVLRIILDNLTEYLYDGFITLSTFPKMSLVFLCPAERGKKHPKDIIFG